MPMQHQQDQHRAQEIRSLACELFAKQGRLTFNELRDAVAGRWYQGDANHVRTEYLLTTMIGSKLSVEFIIDGENIIVKSQMPQNHKAAGPSPEEFVYLFLETQPSHIYHGAIHTVISRFNAVFKSRYPYLNPVEFTQQMKAAGKLAIKPSKGGVLISRPPFGKAITPEDILAKMGL